MSGGDSLKRVARGGALVSVGTLSATILQFVIGIVVIRLIVRDEFGLISLAYIMVGILVTLASLGFGSGVPRFLARYREQGKNSLVSGVAGTALLMSLCISILFALLLYFWANAIAVGFGKPGVQPVLEAFALMIPPLAVMRVLTAIFRGVENARAKALFQDVLLNLSRMLLLLPVVVLEYGFREILWVYVGSVWITFILYLFYAYSNLVRRIPLCFNREVGMELVRFSLPLLGISIMGNLMGWAGTLSLGYLQSADEVALFNAPLRLANIIPIPLVAMVFLYLPVATRLIERRAPEDLRGLYMSTTKWVFLITLPLLLYFLMDAEFVVERLFGDQYREAAGVLQVLVVGFSIHNLLGPNGTTLIAYGDARTVFLGTVLAGISAAVLCLLLVPHYGALGAALGTAMAKTISNIYISIALYRASGIHPFSKHYLKPVLFTLSTGLLVYTLLGLTPASSSLSHLLLFLLIGLLAMAAPLVTRSMSGADLEILGAIERRLWGKTLMTDRISIQNQEK